MIESWESSGPKIDIWPCPFQRQTPLSSVIRLGSKMGTPKLLSVTPKLEVRRIRGMVSGGTRVGGQPNVGLRPERRRFRWIDQTLGNESFRGGSPNNSGGTQLCVFSPQKPVFWFCPIFQRGFVDYDLPVDMFLAVRSFIV